MSDIITKKQRNAHNRERRNVVLAVTSDKSTRKTDVYERLKLSRERANVVLIQTDLTGRNLKNSIRKYMRDNGISSSKGDQLVFLDDDK